MGQSIWLVRDDRPFVIMGAKWLRGRVRDRWQEPGTGGRGLSGQGPLTAVTHTSAQPLKYNTLSDSQSLLPEPAYVRCCPVRNSLTGACWKAAERRSAPGMFFRNLLL